MNAAIDSAALEQVLAADYGFDCASIGRAALHAALAARAAASGQALDAYLDSIVGDRLELDGLMAALPIDESWLLRDPEQFEQVRAALRQHQAGAPLRLLCAPCARGEEAWTLAALLYELGWRAPQAQVLAVDLSAVALQRARSGIYPASAWREAGPLPWWLLRRPDGRLQVDAQLASLVRFECANLLRWPGAAGLRFDLLLSRNFLIYLTVPARAAWIEQLLQLGGPGACWFSARSEPLALWDARLAGVQGAVGAFVRAEPALAAVAEPLPERRVLPERRRSPRPVLPAAAGAAPPVLEVVVAPAAGAEPAIRSRIDQALQALAADRLEQAESLLREVLFLDRRCEEALLHLAALRLRRGDPADAARIHARLRRQSAAEAG